ncbi:hypothetical protein CB0940_06735 [Cercospora beticola]|uniref:Arginine metabolism regulation protein II n=2 Tax=Cercospora beticola TaxID=122368 RepID=A0A2G5H9B1_CERBT|nr:hypothetical protein CB0940_06735 [Cercospora beticola]PIA89125.1 hypothetical protein CB0940_06735 [Cercospora beticola]
MKCERSDTACDGYTFDLRWISAEGSGDTEANTTANDDSAPTSAVRRHLFPEAARLRMTKSTGKNLLQGSVDASLDRVDTLSEDTTSSNAKFVGPFGVFSASPSRHESPQLQTQTSMTAVAVPEDHNLGSTQQLDAYDTSPFEDVLSMYSANDMLQWDDIFDLGTNQNAIMSTFEMLDPLVGTNALFGDSTIANGPIVQEFSQGPVMEHSTLDDQPRETLSQEETMTLAPDLLRHFKSRVIQHMSAMPIANKSPWEIVNLSSAVEAFAQISFMKNDSISSAKSASLFSLLAVSAHHLHLNSMYDEDLERADGLWDTISRSCKEQALANLKQSLQDECSGPRKAKYKDQLGAIMNMLTLAIHTGAQKDARCHIIDAERLMRFRGIAKRQVSRKSRLLHHVYTWIRIVGESTYVLHDYDALIKQLQTNSATAAQQRTDTGGLLDDFLRFETHNGTGTRREGMRMGSQPSGDDQGEDPEHEDTALRDIHLQDSRENPHTLYPKIYGIPETWLKLLSQVTRLANQMDALKAAGGWGGDLDSKARYLENKIRKFSAAPLGGSSALSTTHMYSALNTSLVIFFYRRVKNVDAGMLQSHVDDVIRALTRFDEALVADTTGGGPGTVWPAFIAGCEAKGARKRERISKWIARAADRTGFHCYHQALQLLQDVWNTQPVSGPSSAKHLQASAATRTWMDIMREKNVWLMAC